MRKLKATVLAAVIAASILSGIAPGAGTVTAPPGWELRNGSWVPIIEPGSGTPESQVATMIKELQTRGASAAGHVIGEAKDWIKKNKTHPLMPQVLLIQGDAEAYRGNKYAALYPYEDMLNNYPTSDLYIPVLEREYNIADAFLKGYQRMFLGVHMLPVKEDALTLLDRIQDRQRGSAVAEQAGLRVADFYFETGKFQDAVDAYTDFLRRYGSYSQYARKAQIRRAEAYLGNFRGLLFDFTPLDDARRELEGITTAYPQTAEELQIRAINDRVYQLEGQKELEIARYYFRAGKKHASAYYYNRVIANWPDTLFAETARKEIVRRLPTEVRR